MNVLTYQMMPELLSVKEGTCISLYMPTHRNHPDNLADVILYKNLLKDLEQSLLQKYTDAEATVLLEPFVNLGEDREFWNHTLDGLAVLSSTDVFKTISLPVATEALTVVANSFHTKPLRKYLQSIERYNVLGLSLHDFQMFEGNRHSLTELVIPSNIPKNIAEALGDVITDRDYAVASYGNIGNMHQGHGGKTEEMDLDAERFFRYVAQTINDNYSSLSGLPLILAALPEHHSLFHKVSNNLLLLPNSIDVNPKSVNADDLIKSAWEIMEPYYNEIIEKACDNFQQAKGNELGSDVISEVAAAAAAGKVETLLIESDRQIAGKITGDAGTIEKGDLDNPDIDDLLDDLGELVTKMGGKVMVIPQDKMPTETGVAGVYRY